MKDNFEPALTIGSCVITGCGVISFGLGTVPGLVVGSLAIMFGITLLYQAWKLSEEE